LFDIDFSSTESTVFIRNAKTKSVSTNTLAELYTDARALAKTLDDIGLPKRCRVGLLAKNAYRWLVWDIALLYSGRTSVIFTDDFENDNVSELTETYGLSLIVSDCGDDEYPYHCSIDAPPTLPTENRAATVDDDDVLSLVFSSGSSGNLKGLTISRQGFQHDVTVFAELYSLTSQDSMLTFLPLSNNQQRLLYWSCLLARCSIVVTPVSAAYTDSSALNPTFFIAPPSYYDNLLKIISGASPESRPLFLHKLVGNNIRFCITGMAPIAKSSLEKLANAGLPIVEVYGQTELGVITVNTPNDNCVGSVGKPIKGVSLKIGDDGEVVVLKKPKLTINYFQASEDDISNTFMHDGLVATGDIASVDAAHNLYIEGRKKDGIVTRSGEKFQPVTVEKLLDELECIDKSVVLTDARQNVFAAIFTLDERADIDTVVEKHIQSVNKGLDPNRQVHAWTILRVTLSRENKMLTPNLKLNRIEIRRMVLESLNSESAVEV